MARSTSASPASVPPKPALTSHSTFQSDRHTHKLSCYNGRKADHRIQCSKASGERRGHPPRLRSSDVGHTMWIDDLDDGFLMAVGPGTTGRLLEIGIVEGADGPVVVHAMPARAKYVR